MARIRIFLLSCGRPTMLPRAFTSLRKQTFTDWICEVHNDCPSDQTPRRLVAEAADSRFELREHDRRWGAVAVFNHAFRGGPEPFLSLLEDDNWWEPTLLERLLAALESHPTAALAWANMRIWQEEPDGGWTETDATIWDTRGASEPVVFDRPVLLQSADALHSNGAMLCRRSASAQAQVPPETPFAIIEPVRERLLRAPMILLPQPLGHFSRTQSSARGRDRTEWIQAQLLVIESFVQGVRLDREAVRHLWRSRRRLRPRGTTDLVIAALAGATPRRWLRHATAGDWMVLIRGTLRRPRLLWHALHYRQRHAELRRALLGSAETSADVLPLMRKVLPTSAKLDGR